MESTQSQPKLACYTIVSKSPKGTTRITGSIDFEELTADSFNASYLQLLSLTDRNDRIVIKHAHGVMTLKRTGRDLVIEDCR